jgi:hypothetical protein
MKPHNPDPKLDPNLNLNCSPKQKARVSRHLAQQKKNSNMTTLGRLQIPDHELQAAIFDVDGPNVSPAILSGEILGVTVRLAQFIL